MSCVVIAEDNGLKERDYVYSTRRNFEKTDSAKIIGELSAKKVISRLGAKPISTQKCPVILTPELSVGLFSSSLSGLGIIYIKNSFLIDRLGEKIFSDHINISEIPIVEEGLEQGLLMLRA